MSFFKTSKKQEDVKAEGGSKYITKSGCYPVNIIAPFVSTSKGGSISIDLFLEHETQKQVLYGNMRITNNDGTPNKIGSKIFNQLTVIADVEEVDDPIDAELPIGKDEEMKDVAVLENLADLDVLIRVQMEYSVYNGNIQEKKIIKGFYRAEDKASAEEIVNNANYGTQYEKDTKYFDNVTYKDGLTEETVQEWIKNNRPKGTAGNASSSAAEKPSFGKKKRAFGS